VIPTCATWNAVFDALAAPQPAEDGTPDDRTPPARRHDALLDAGQRLLRTGSLPEVGGAAATILVTLSEALAARDGGCSFPGCTAPPAWCQVHHIRPWEHGSPTDLANLTLVCGHHHRQFHQQGWTCHMIKGLLHWQPPPWIDPDRNPRRNTAHHLPIRFPGAAIRSPRPDRRE